MEYITDEKELLGILRGFYTEAKKARKKKEKGWKQFRNLYFDKEDEVVSITGENKEKTIRNYVTATVRQLGATLMDSKPQMHALPLEPGLMDTAQALSDYMERIWYENQMNVLMPAVLCDVLIEGTGILKTFYDAGLDMVNTREVSSLNYYPDPYGGLFLKNHRYAIEYCALDEHQFRQKYPDYVGEVATIGEGNEKEDKENEGIISKAGKLFKQAKDKLQKHKVRQRYAVLEFWFRDPAIVDDIRVFPDGRRIVTDANLQFILEDQANPFETDNNGHGMFPYSIFRDYVHTEEFWGTGDVKDIENIQELANKLFDQIKKNAELTTNNVLVAEEGALATPADNLQMEPGDVIVTKPGRMNGVQWMDAPQIPNDVMNLLLDDERFVELQTGASRAARGQTPTGQAKSGRAILALQQASDRRVRYKVQHLEVGWQRLGEQWLGLIQQFYPEGKRAPIDTENGREIIRFTNEFLTNKFDIQIQPDSSLPIDKYSIYQRLIEVAGILTQSGQPMPPQLLQAILKYSDVPNWQSLTKQLMQQPTQQGQPIQTGR